MPYITVESGVLSDEQKELLIKRLTEVSCEIMNVPKEFFTTTIKELPEKNLGIGGKTIDKVKAEYMQTHKYFDKDTSVCKGNKIFFNNTVMMLNDDEFDEFLSDLQKLFVKYHFEAADGRKPRDISMISAPPMEGNHEE